MLVTCLNPILGYEKAAKIAQYAFEHKTDLATAAAALAYLTKAEAERILDPKAMV